MLCCGTYVVKQNQLVGPATVEVADGVENTVPDERREQLLNEESQKTTADDGQVQVVDLERTVQAEGCAVPHDLAAAQNDDVVCNERNDRLFVCRHESAAGRELELLSRVAKHLLPCGGENGPECDAEGTVESRDTDLEVLEGRHAGGRVVELLWVFLRVLFQRATVFVEYQSSGKRRIKLDFLVVSRAGTSTVAQPVTECASWVAGRDPTLSKGAT